ncbi:hypothetical protein JXM83_00190 [Candidatus Woesearchaeota archaeon]|nr:hypothetical protein [Candidatus Woesearchaeota archaeon]
MSLDKKIHDILHFILAKKNYEDYIPYIHHELDVGCDTLHLNELKGDLFSVSSGNVYTGENPIFNSVKADIPDSCFEIAKDPNSVMVVLPRHKSLYDHLVGQPVHHDVINKNLMLMAGNNLFHLKFGPSLRNNGAFMFVRNDTVLFRKGMIPTHIRAKDYSQFVLPEYLFREMIEGPIRHDMMCFLGQRKTSSGRETGRTKTGELRPIGGLFLKTIGDLIEKYSEDYGVKFYAVPANFSFSKYPDAPYVVHDDEIQNPLWKLEKYFWQQRFVFETYPKHCESDYRAKLDAVVKYGEPILMNGNVHTFRKSGEFAEMITQKIGELEAVFPITLLYKSLNGESKMHLDELFSNMQENYENLKSKSVDVSAILEDMVRTYVHAVGHLNSNPFYHLDSVKHSKLIVTDSDGIVHSTDSKLQNWYSNTITHLI